MNIDQEINKIASKFNMSSTVVYILAAFALVIILSQVFG